MFPSDDDAGTTAISYTDQFLEAGIAKLDALFGAGYAKANPAALAAYLAACASNLNAFMLAATSLDDGAFDEALAAFEEQILQPAPKPKGRRR
ncbi:hypothetical protein [Amaricoccus sp.]|uniref:hypothetical protein n=1 Tax=Amaricoccus sp. TaxID=1872485 RepID=UPI002621D386|nr:hypothetical protein [Amaricoccus sp.]HRO11852.1 hypothetical protein [Amaricoccus sp.]